MSYDWQSCSAQGSSDCLFSWSIFIKRVLRVVSLLLPCSRTRCCVSRVQRSGLCLLYFWVLDSPNFLNSLSANGLCVASPRSDLSQKPLYCVILSGPNGPGRQLSVGHADILAEISCYTGVCVIGIVFLEISVHSSKTLIEATDLGH